MGNVLFRFPYSGGKICNPSPDRRILKSDHYGRIYLLPRKGGQPNGVRQVSVLSEMAVGDTGILVALDLPESVQNHLMHMGFVPDALVTALRKAPAGDPTVYGIDGMEIALRHETATAIRVRPIESSATIPDTLTASEDDASFPEGVQLTEVAQ